MAGTVDMGANADRRCPCRSAAGWFMVSQTILMIMIDSKKTLGIAFQNNKIQKRYTKLVEPLT